MIGAILCICTGFLIGNYFLENINKRYNALKQIRQIMVSIAGEILYTRSNISDIFLKISKKQEYPYREFMDYIYKETYSTNGRLSNIWTRGVDIYMRKLNLNEKDIELLNNMGSVMGSVGIDIEIENLRKYIEELDEQITHIKEELQGKKKLYRMLGLLCGVAISVILI